MSDNPRQQRSIGVKTLAVTSASSVLATLLVPMIWRPGTLAAAAAMPVIVSLVSEALNRPAAQVTRAGHLVRERRRRRGGDDPTEIDLPARNRRRKRRTRAAVLTGLLAFAIVAVVWTVGELAAGQSLSGGERSTYFGGSAPEKQPAEPTPTPAAPAATPGGDAEATPTPEETEKPASTPTPTPGVGPQTTPRPEAPPTTPAPAATPPPAG